MIREISGSNTWRRKLNTRRTWHTTKKGQLWSLTQHTTQQWREIYYRTGRLLWQESATWSSLLTATGPRRSQNGSFPDIFRCTTTFEREVSVYWQLLKSLQMHEIKWSNKKIQIERRPAQITRKYLAKRDKSTFAIKYIEKCLQDWGGGQFFSLFYSGINMVPCSHFTPTRQNTGQLFLAILQRNQYSIL